MAPRNRTMHDTLYPLLPPLFLSFLHLTTSSLSQKDGWVHLAVKGIQILELNVTWLFMGPIIISGFDMGLACPGRSSCRSSPPSFDVK